MPACDTSPTVGLMPTTALCDDGQTIEPSVSVPIAAAHRLAAGATPDPELEPHGSAPRSYGLRVKPPRALQPLTWTPASATAFGWKPRKFAHSDRFALPRMTAPAARSRATTVASRGTRLPTRASEPAVVSIASLVAMLSLTRTGMPWSGPRTRPRRRSASRRAAISSAAGLVSMTACRIGSRRSIRREVGLGQADGGHLADASNAPSSGIDASNHGADASSSMAGISEVSIGASYRAPDLAASRARLGVAGDGERVRQRMTSPPDRSRSGRAAASRRPSSP